MRRRDEVLVGILMTVALVLVILGTLWLARGGLSSGYPLYARFPWGAGLKQGQPVLLAGVSVGYVDDIQLRRDGWLDVTMRVNDEYQVPMGSTAKVVPIGFFGDQAIALTPTGITVESYAVGDTIPIGAQAPGMAELIARVDSIGRNMSDVTQAIEFQLVQAGGLQDLRSTLAATNQLVLRLNAIAAEQARELTLATTALRRAATAVDSATIDSTMKSIRQSGENLSVLTGELATASASFTSIMAKVDTGGGSLGKLVNDSLLYRDVRMLVMRLDSLTADFKKNPRRYINLEIF